VKGQAGTSEVSSCSLYVCASAEIREEGNPPRPKEKKSCPRRRPCSLTRGSKERTVQQGEIPESSEYELAALLDGFTVP
jgi:hypothetical protein